MSGLDVDTRTDVYALGVVLYWLLAGVLPFEPEELRANGLDEIRRKIREEEPPRPSTALSKLRDKSVAVATRRRSDPTKLSRSLRGDLDWIVMKALEKDRTRRYSSASEMSADIGRHLRNEPVLAGPPTSAYRIRKFVTWHRGAVVSAAVLVFLLVAFSITVSVQSLRIARERDRAQAEAEKALAVKAFIERTLLSPDPVGGLGVNATIIEALERATRDLEETLTGTPEAEAAVRYALGMAYFKLGRFAEADPLLRVSLRARRELLEEPHVDITDAAFAVGDLEAVQGNYEAAAENRAPPGSFRGQGRTQRSSVAAPSWAHSASCGPVTPLAPILRCRYAMWWEFRPQATTMGDAGTTDPGFG